MRSRHAYLKLTSTAKPHGSSAKVGSALRSAMSQHEWREGARLVVRDGGVVPGRVEGDHQPRRHAAVEVVLKVLLQPVVLVAALAEVLVRREDGHVHAGHVKTARINKGYSQAFGELHRPGYRCLVITPEDTVVLNPDPAVHPIHILPPAEHLSHALPLAQQRICETLVRRLADLPCAACCWASAPVPETVR